jgi:uncharacterized membrane protein
MNFPHVHLLLNHIPVLGTGFAFLLLLAGLWRKSDDLRRAAFALFILVALLAIPTYLTGEPSGEILVKQGAVSSWQVERHDAAAEIALTALECLGGLSLLCLLLDWRKFAAERPLRLITAAVAVVVIGLMAWTANLGGQIRHPELGGNLPATHLPIRD